MDPDWSEPETASVLLFVRKMKSIPSFDQKHRKVCFKVWDEMFVYITEPDCFNVIFFLEYNNEKCVKECTRSF